MASPASPARKFISSGLRELDPTQKIEEERFGDYVAERYYPVNIGEIFCSRYQIITKLGFGATSTIWLCRDLREHRYLTMKVNVRSKRPNPEVELTNYMKSIEDIHGGEVHVRRVLDSFSIDGPHGTHCCILYEPTGIDLSDFIHRLETGALPQVMLRPAVRYILIALDYIHQLGIIHTDDQSVLSQLEQDELQHPIPRKQTPSRTIYLTREMPITKGFPILSDMGEARRAETKQRGLIQPSIYRAPEVMLDMEWDNKVDIWGLAQTIWTIFEQRHLFDNINPMGELDHGRRFAEMISLMGPPPLEFLKKSKESLKYWDENGDINLQLLNLCSNWKLSHMYPIPKQSLESSEIQLKGDEKKQFLEFMRKMLQWVPEDRADAQHLLFEDPWVRGGDY
ncbi:hypothetical protein TRV_06817 [Trichophyton verrucosum HKI 0517]|uniref:non-specific serine/threonine protein kinase n=1 Tax=Trichophyton verrucosum (strain HKI 0517) TaxID=663202 RepID=D4DI10_TRIVH|nr:uncharacterized protein TRV_06817 [Trichophyton verrucosum HKI 0517]EFE38488.1 hypothetical protein TRV_06817 [Trichophyton verrucosum HKI 0517]